MKSWLKFIEEKKDHLIKKVPSLTDDEKELIIAFFNKHNSLEKMIDWNNVKNLTMMDFQKVMDSQQALKISKGSAKLNVDYIELDSLDKINKAFMPFTWEGAKYLASNKVNKMEGKWCIGYEQYDNYWVDYGKENLFIIYVTPTSKFALQYEKNNFKPIKIWDKYDKAHSPSKSKELINLSMKELLTKNKSTIIKNMNKWPSRFIEDDSHGGIKVVDMNLTSLKGCPKEVRGSFNCAFNKLTSLEDVPNVIGTTFDCSYNELKSLKGCPSVINGSFVCSGNKLTSLKYAPKTVGESFNCSGNQLTSLKYAPKDVGYKFNCSGNQLTSLEGAPKKIGRYFDCSKNKLTSLEGCPKEVDGDFYLRNNNGKKFTEEEIRAVCDVKGMVIL